MFHMLNNGLIIIHKIDLHLKIELWILKDLKIREIYNPDNNFKFVYLKCMGDFEFETNVPCQNISTIYLVFFEARFKNSMDWVYF